MIHFGSGAEYDKSKPIVKVKETDFGKVIPKDEYGFFKYICSKYIEKTDKIICLRILAYSENMKITIFVSYLMQYVEIFSNYQLQ